MDIKRNGYPDFSILSQQSPRNYKLFQKQTKKNPQQNLKPVRQAQPTDSRIGHFAQLQKYISEWHRGSQIKRLLLYTLTNKPPTNITSFLLNLKIIAVLSCGLRQRTALQPRLGRRGERGQRHLLLRCCIALMLSGTRKEAEQNCSGWGKPAITTIVSCKFSEVRSQYWIFNPTLNPCCQFTKQLFFMFYMNSSNLLIKITELSIEKVSNWIQTIQMLKLS